MLVVLPVLLYLTAQIGSAVKLRGLARCIALLPVIPLARVTYVTIQAFRHDSNVWPSVVPGLIWRTLWILAPADRGRSERTRRAPTTYGSS